MNLKNITADKLVALYKNRDLTVTEVITNVYDEIEHTDRDVRSFISLSRDRALEEARRLDTRIAAGERLEPLAGVPVAIKDNMTIRDTVTTCGSRILENYAPPYTATAVERLRGAGAIVIGKTNCDEFAMGSSTENSAFFVTRNPHNLDRVPGGSSGGSAASVASGTSLIALGSDTGGSIRTPASFCGVVGVKPTYGRVSRYGLVAFASSLDQIGPFAKSVRECAQALEAISGFDHFDSTSADVATPEFARNLDQPIKGTRIGVPKEYFIAGLDPEVKAKIEAGMKIYQGLGCELREISLPHTEYAIATYYLIATAEASSNLARYDAVRYGLRAGGNASLQEMYRRTRHEGFGKEVKRRILLGTYALSAGYYDAYYLKALKVRTLLLRDFQKAFEQVDVILTPTSPTVAFKIGEKTGDPLSMYLSDIFTITLNLAGLPGISIPCGKNSENMPIGMQLMTNHFQEALLLSVAHHFEKAGGFAV
ncbi:MAG TPA: Asp-tRNA(Asn)/Glu-tRNA(Gln) amidotransferase subunit GatA [Terriglobia bacterium]|nr:Asp-tRNA(Asn)/Glu-tRNA(Gln) amidotransferase subunit GatA [Terriglobia bacterium]